MTESRSEKILITGGSGFIGTNFVEFVQKQGHPLLNLDISQPLNRSHFQFWRKVDILDPEGLDNAFASFQPDWVVHLAARTDCDENTTVEKDYIVNTFGTENVLNAIKSTPSVSRAILTSTQFVCRPGIVPANDEVYDPHTVYGQSKVIAEQLTRSANLTCTWTIIRPTNIWGPWHLRYLAQFLRILQKGLYFHPRGRPCTKSYGYVGNVVHQIAQILVAPSLAVNGRTLYVGDKPIELLTWVDAFSKELRGKPVCIMPYWAMQFAAMCGDIISTCTGKPFLLNSGRFRSMVDDYIAPMDETFALLGNSPASLLEGVRETVRWLREYENDNAESKK